MKKLLRVILFCCIYAVLFLGIFSILYYRNWLTYHGHADFLVRPFFDSLDTSMSRVLDIPFAWLFLSGKAREVLGCPTEYLVWFRLCSFGVLLALAAGLSCLMLVSKGVFGRRTALLSLFLTPILMDCALGFRDWYMPSVALLYAFLPSLLLLAALGWKTISLVRRRQDFANPSRVLAVYSIGLLANTLSFVALLACFISAWRTYGSSFSWGWGMLISPFPGIWLVAWVLPIDSIGKAAGCLAGIGGLWGYIICAGLFCSRFAGTRQERKPALLNLAWFTCLFHFSLPFWIGGYSVRSVVYLFLPALAAITMTVFLLGQAVCDKKLSRRKTQIILLTISILSEIMTFILMFDSVDYSAFGASC